MTMSELCRRVILAAALGALTLGIPEASAQKKLVVYSANDSTLNDLTFNAFNKETGITVEPVAAGSGVLMRRLAEREGQPQADIIWGVSARCCRPMSTSSRPMRPGTRT